MKGLNIHTEIKIDSLHAFYTVTSFFQKVTYHGHPFQSKHTELLYS